MRVGSVFGSLVVACVLAVGAAMAQGTIVTAISNTASDAAAGYGKLYWETNAQAITAQWQDGKIVDLQRK